MDKKRKHVCLFCGISMAVFLCFAALMVHFQTEVPPAVVFATGGEAFLLPQKPDTPMPRGTFFAPELSASDNVPGSHDSMPDANLPISSFAALAWAPLVDRLAADGYERETVQAMFISLADAPLPEFMAQKVIEVANLRYKSKAALVLAKEEAANFSPPNYSSLGGLSAAAGRKFMDRNAAMFTSIYNRYGVAAPYVVAILMVETGLGGNLGERPAMLALGSMACSSGLDGVLPSVAGLGKLTADRRETLAKVVNERSEWAYLETRALIDYCLASGKDPLTLPGSIYGAIGLPQFMPSNISVYGVDADGDKVVDLFKLGDAAYSIARYLAAHGWKDAVSPAATIAVLKRYNNSDVYASTVYGVAMQLITPTTYQGAESARQGGSAIAAARRDARAAIPSGKVPEGAKVTTLGDYGDLLK